MTNSDLALTQRNFNKFSVWLQCPEAARVCEQQVQLIQEHFASALVGPQIGLVNCDERFSTAIENVPGLVQHISCECFISQRSAGLPAASLNSIVVPFALSFLGDHCDVVNWQQLNHLLAPGGQLLMFGITPKPPASLVSKDKPPAIASQSASEVTKQLAQQGFRVQKSLFHGLNSRTGVPSIYCSQYAVFSPLFFHWAILFKQTKPSGTLVGGFKSPPRKQINSIGSNRQT